MNSDYVAWNGERYVWPPPEGWYLASDGRWWAPDTGPEIYNRVERTAASASTTVDEPQPGQTSSTVSHVETSHLVASDVEPSHLASSHVEASVDLGHAETTPADGEVTTLMADGASFKQAEQEPAPVDHQPTLIQPAPRPTDEPLDRPPPGHVAAVLSPEAHIAIDDATDHGAPGSFPSTGPQPIPTATPEVTVKRTRTMPMVAAGLLVAAALGIAALLALFNGDDSGEQQQPSASLQPSDENPDELVVTTQPGDDAMTDGSMADGMADVTDESMTDGDAVTEQESPDSQSSTTVAATADDAARIGQFRTLLEDNQITAAELTGDDLAAFGATACSYAESAGDTAEYEQIRAGVLDGAQNDELTVEELQFIIDAAVTVFCADDASRLGITLDTAG
jgi:hypothetical protein